MWVGPYEGRIVSVDSIAELHNSTMVWEVYDNAGDISHFIDGSDPAQANWMRYIRCARSESEQNMAAFQHLGQIYFRYLLFGLPISVIIMLPLVSSSSYLLLPRSLPNHPFLALPLQLTPSPLELTLLLSPLELTPSLPQSMSHDSCWRRADGLVRRRVQALPRPSPRHWAEPRLVLRNRGSWLFIAWPFRQKSVSTTVYLFGGNPASIGVYSKL